MSARDELAAQLRPLVSRMCVSHCWVKGKNGPRHIDEPFTEVSLSEHVTGSRIYGLCPITPGGSACRVACLDFDSHGGETNWATMLHVADQVALTLECDGYAPTLFRSSGGNGVHLILTWNEEQDAYSVREMLKNALASCGLKSGTAGVAAGECEIFPKQSSVAIGEFGSMFILPLGGGTRSELIRGGW